MKYKEYFMTRKDNVDIKILSDKKVKKIPKNIKNLKKKICSELNDGVGYFIIKDFDLKNINLKKTYKYYANFMSMLGNLQKQNKLGEKIVKIQDGGKKWSANIRGYKTSDKISFHTDGGDVAAMLCISQSNNGGESLITPANKIYQKIKKLNPAYLKILKKGFHYHNRGEVLHSKSLITKKRYPVFFNKKGKIHCMFNKNPILWAAKHSNKKINKEALKAINLVEKISNEKKNITKYKLTRGDLLLVNNHKVLHGRNKFKDPNQKQRLILRAWITLKSSKYSGPTLLNAYNDS